MTNQQNSSFRRINNRQRGDLLIESLIGMVLMAIIGMGVVFVTSKMSVSQRDMRMQEIAVNQMRALLMNNGSGAINICTTTPTINIPGIQNAQVEVQGCGAGSTTTATIAGTTITNIPRPLYISVTHEKLGGQIVVGGNWN